MKKVYLVIIIVVIIVIAAVLLLTTMSKGPSPAPGLVYKGSKEYSLPSYYYQWLNIPTQVAVRTYFVEGVNAAEVLNWYKAELPRVGYEILQPPVIQTLSTPQGSLEWGLLIAKRGDMGLGVWAVSGAQVAVEGRRGTLYLVAEGNIKEFVPPETSTPGEKLPPTDLASGEEPIERYPGSKMLTYQKSEGFPTVIIIDYGTADNMQKVAEWYKKELQLKGWDIKDERRSAEKISLHLIKEREELGVVIYAPTSERSYTSISIHYGLYKLPTRDLASGEEPIERYPGSIMLRHSSTTYMGVKMIDITYATHDGVDKVASWYDSYLAANQWQVATSSVSDGAKTVTAFKKKAFISLTVSPKAGYTEINIVYQG
ncbi:MAG: hypothetical protein ACK4SY_07765 [Pyrobaculum sp.]